MVVVGSGPNGLAAAITAARAGRSVVVLEANDSIGGACRSTELTEPGFVHDVGSAIHPLALCSPFMKSIPWANHGLSWVDPPASVAHPIQRQRAVIGWRDLDQTAEGLGLDGDRYRSLFRPMVTHFDDLVDMTMRAPFDMIRKPLSLVRFGPKLGLSATAIGRLFKHDAARALFAGHAAHSIAPLSHPFTAGFGFLLGASVHSVGWGFPKGGAGEITRVLSEVFAGLGGEIRTNHRVGSDDDLLKAGATIFAMTPRQVHDIVGHQFPERAGKSLRRFRYGPGACKVDFAASAPIPWIEPEVGRAATVHLGGTMEEIAAAEAAVAKGKHAERPFVLLAQHSLFDPSRAPEGKHTVWAYCHVPNGSKVDASVHIEAQIERVAPGFSETIVGKNVSFPADLERNNANLVGGDVGGGSYTKLQAVFRPGLRRRPHTTVVPGYFVGSASASPGAGVHGMAGLMAATEALRYLDGKRT